MDENRFSILLLEKDVLQYVKYKNKFNEYEQKCRVWYRCCHRKTDATKKASYYLKYIQSMRKLEQKYRHVNIYTSYHKGLEKLAPIHENQTISTQL